MSIFSIFSVLNYAMSHCLVLPSHLEVVFCVWNIFGIFTTVREVMLYQCPTKDFASCEGLSLLDNPQGI